VRETWALIDLITGYQWPGLIPEFNNGYQPVYKATMSDFEDSLINSWYPSIHMPRWASRITLEILNVRIERLQEMSEYDAIKEGFAPQGHSLALAYFIELWDSLYTKKPEYQWQANPWVWVIEFAPNLTEKKT